MVEKPTIKELKPKKNLEKSDLHFTVNLKVLLHKTSFDPKLLQLKKFSRNNQEERATEDVSPVLN